MTRITEETITRKGLDYVISLDEFEVHGNHYYPYPEILGLDEIKDKFTLNTTYHGSSDQGVAVTIFTKKPTEQQLHEKLLERIIKFSENNNIKITSWDYIK